jgi:predicted N-acetyltransferase YhbS
MCVSKSDDANKIIVTAAITVSSLVAIAAAALFVKNIYEKKKIGGKLIRVNYKFSKEFDD